MATRKSRLLPQQCSNDLPAVSVNYSPVLARFRKITGGLRDQCSVITIGKATATNMSIIAPLTDSKQDKRPFSQPSNGRPSAALNGDGLDGDHIGTTVAKSRRCGTHHTAL